MIARQHEAQKYINTIVSKIQLRVNDMFLSMTAAKLRLVASEENSFAEVNKWKVQYVWLAVEWKHWLRSNCFAKTGLLHNKMQFGLLLPLCLCCMERHTNCKQTIFETSTKIQHDDDDDDDDSITNWFRLVYPSSSTTQTQCFFVTATIIEYSIHHYV